MRYIKNNMAIKLTVIFVLCSWLTLWVMCASPKTEHEQFIEDQEQMEYLKDNK